ncbi:deoxyribodipyrimidine photolyase [Sphingobacterium alkalisoli]|uniref:Deoxyribodipyrimidine photolyase n=1 Tax=Sphingobacterium alkalisoli TaxID=1874115 RepID=A0A4U0GX79_9SPHI|nr:deoxyribodipyrimidine photo-lyase [Sphingobacterium alkalisoli]TJY62422.1 deoxyribodipyrimidine photolyase [Sphingobacterium alkalisoli]GGH29574.1 cryptochrome DASH [Sphingobacterium alkalisoli]
MSKRVILVWFRNDLRTHDNEVLHAAIDKADFVIPVYIFDPRYYQINKSGYANTGEIRSLYISNTVSSLKEKLQSLGGDLMTFEGLPEEIIPHLVQKYDVDEVYHHREVARTETSISEKVEEELWKIQRNLKHFIGHTLYHKEDLPFPIKDIPNSFNVFKKKIERESSVRSPLADIGSITIPPHLEKTELPRHEETVSYTYGEKAAIEQLNAIFSQPLVNEDLYIKLSPFLAIGSLSPVYTYHYISKQITPSNKKQVVKIIERLLWRDYYRFMLKKYPNKYFLSQSSLNPDAIKIEKWRTGNTEYPTINVYMQELNNTGIISYVQREILALFFTYEYQQPWLEGAAWFEEKLIDYAPATNYGFWAHIAGEGTSEKDNKSMKEWEKEKTSI